MANESLRVAVADENSMERAAIKEMLENLGHNVVAEAHDGTQLAEQLTEKKPDVLVTDLEMAGIEEISRSDAAEKQSTPIVVMTSEHAPQHVQSALKQANVVGYLARPFGSSTLDGVLRFALGLFHRFRGLESRLGMLQRSHEDRELINRAKQLLMQQSNLDEETAHRKLQKMASASNRKLIDLARAMLEAAANQDKLTR